MHLCNYLVHFEIALKVPYHHFYCLLIWSRISKLLASFATSIRLIPRSDSEKILPKQLHKVSLGTVPLFMWVSMQLFLWLSKNKWGKNTMFIIQSHCQLNSQIIAINSLSEFIFLIFNSFFPFRNCLCPAWNSSGEENSLNWRIPISERLKVGPPDVFLFRPKRVLPLLSDPCISLSHTPPCSRRSSSLEGLSARRSTKEKKRKTTVGETLPPGSLCAPPPRRVDSFDSWRRLGAISHVKQYYQFNLCRGELSPCHPKVQMVKFSNSN